MTFQHHQVPSCKTCSPHISTKTDGCWTKNRGVSPQIIHLFIGFPINSKPSIWGVFPLFLVQHPIFTASKISMSSTSYSPRFLATVCVLTFRCSWSRVAPWSAATQSFTWRVPRSGAMMMVVFKPYLVGGWTNPSEKYESKWESSPIFGVKIKNIWNHHLVKYVANCRSC